MGQGVLHDIEVNITPSLSEGQVLLIVLKPGVAVCRYIHEDDAAILNPIFQTGDTFYTVATDISAPAPANDLTD